MSGALLTVEDLRVSFPGDGRPVKAVDGVSFQIGPGELWGLVGESGSGKSVTGLSLIGLTRELGAEVSGRALLAPDGSRPVDLVGADESELRRLRGARVAMIFQDPLSSLNPFHRVGDQIAEAVLAHGGASRGQAQRRAIELLGEVGIADPKRRARDFPHQFSGGMRQRVMIAIALANEPELLIADEPTTALDLTTQAQILDLIVRLRAEHGMAVLLISHDLGVVAERAERVMVMRAGRLVERGTVGEVFTSPAADYTRALLAAVPRLDAARLDLDRRDAAACHDDRRPPRAEPGPSAGMGGPGGGDVLVETRELRLTFPGRRGLWGRGGDDVRAVDGVSLRAEAGSTLGVVGESGSGKSTLCRLIMRLLTPDAGEVRFAGQEISRLSGRRMRELRGSMQMVFQDPFSSLNPRHRVGTIVAAPMRLHGEWRGAELDRRVAEMLERVGLDPADRDRFPHEFSGGQRQRIAIARALGPRPRLVVADEPVSSLDVTIQSQILALLRELQDELGLTYIFVSHDLAVVSQIADRVIVMREGRVVERGSASQVCTAPQDPYTRRLLAAVPKLPAL